MSTRIGAPGHMSTEEFRRHAAEVAAFIGNYLDGAGSGPVGPRVAPGDVARGIGPGVSAAGEEWEAIWADAERVVMPGLTGWQHPSFFGYFPCNGSYPAILADLLSTGLGEQGMLWQTSPACTEVETRIVDWVADLIGLPGEFRSDSDHRLDHPDNSESGGEGGGGGVIQSTASDATLVALVAARHRARRRASRAGPGRADERLTLYASSQAHSSVVKAAMIAGLADGPDDGRAVRLIETDRTLRLDTDKLAAAMARDAAEGRVPFFVCATVGTTGTGAVDPVLAICDAARPHGAWVHVDAAWAGAALVCPEHRAMIEGVGAADSLCFNPHKWLLTSFDCDCMFTRDRRSLTGSLSITPEYLRNAATDSGVIDYRDWQVPLGRRFRALKLWFVLRWYGVEGLRAHVREGVRLADVFEGLVRADERFSVPVPRSLSLVCFRLRDDDAAGRRTRELMRLVNATGRAMLTHTTIPRAGFVIRMAIGGTATREEHVRAAWGQIAAAADRVS